MRAVIVSLLMLSTISGAFALDCDEVDYVYRLDKDQASGFRHMLPVEQDEIVEFDGWANMTITVGDEVTSYKTLGGGTGITTHTAWDPNKVLEPLVIKWVDLSGRVKEGEPDQLLLLDHDVYWPECP